MSCTTECRAPPNVGHMNYPLTKLSAAIVVLVVVLDNIELLVDVLGVDELLWVDELLICCLKKIYLRSKARSFMS